MKLNSRIMVTLSISLWMFIGCGSVASDSSTSKSNLDATQTAVAGVSIDAVIDASSDNYKVLKLDGDKNLQLKLGDEAKDVYVLFSNPNSVAHAATVTHNNKRVETVNTNKKEFNAKPFNHQDKQELSFIQEFNNQLFDFKNDKKEEVSLRKTYKTVSDTQGEKKVFYMDATSKNREVNATARKVISNVQTQFGAKSLTIWVEDDAYGENCKKVKCVNDNMIGTLANKFLKSGYDNDIYDWVTNVFGEEWGVPTSSSLIDESNHISILLTDISQDNKASGGVIGYFYSKDNFNNNLYSGSNERIMFYIDSVMYANSTTSSWDENDFWPQQVFSTLAHEFQHMIYFYQKNVKQGIQGTDTWINEMLSESTEDLVAVKMGVDGPRNVVSTRGDTGNKNNHNGRYPLFNKNNTLSPKSWDNTLENYSTVSSFGAYLIRNYGGAKLLHDIVHSEFINEEALMDAIHKDANGKSKTFDDLIHDWGVAVLLSKRDDISVDSGELYNAGDYISSSFNNIQYDLGSIDFFNYNPAPFIHSAMGQVDPKSNYYYKVGENLKGDIDVDISDTAGLNVSVVVVK